MEEKEVIETPETETEDGEIDYKALAEQERAGREQAEANASKWEKRFKTTKANENKAPGQQIDQESIKKMVDESVGVVKFYSENKDANQYQQDIEALVAKGIDRNQAFKYVLAEKDPSLLLDDAKRAQLNGNTALNGVPAIGKGVKTLENITKDDLKTMSDEEFDKLFATAGDKKFFTQQ